MPAPERGDRIDQWQVTAGDRGDKLQPEMPGYERKHQRTAGENHQGRPGPNGTEGGLDEAPFARPNADHGSHDPVDAHHQPSQ